MRRESKVPYEERCPTHFERSTPGRMYVNRRWQCPRKKLKGLPYCSYCEPSDKKRERLSMAARATP
jgi:hypothetical protein